MFETQSDAPRRRPAVVVVDRGVFFAGVGVSGARLARPQEEQVQSGAQEQVMF